MKICFLFATRFLQKSFYWKKEPQTRSRRHRRMLVRISVEHESVCDDQMTRLSFFYSCMNIGKCAVSSDDGPQISFLIDLMITHKHILQ